MGVKVTFTEFIVPGKRPPKVGETEWRDLAQELDVPRDVSMLDVLGAHFDSDWNVWRILTRRYQDVD